MVNFSNFLSAFGSYFIVFLIFATAIVLAAFIGISLRKIVNKNKQKKAEE